VSYIAEEVFSECGDKALSEEKFSQYFDIAKLDQVQKIVYGKALVPDKMDTQQDTMTKEDIEKTAHDFLINLQKAYVELSKGNQVTKASEIGLMHTIFKGVGGFGYVVESYIDPEGSWVLATKITDDVVWNKIVKGEITGYSVGGRGKRVPL
jgi:hypothetical protein